MLTVPHSRSAPSDVRHTAPSHHWPFLDLLKGVGAQLIALHHLAIYGPMSDYARTLAPDVLHFLSDYALLVVQVFIVVAGFLAARSLAPDGAMRPRSLGPTIWKRYLRSGLPYAVALVVAVAANAFARLWMDHPSLSDNPSLGSWLAHLLMLPQILGYESISAGVWYVAIDLQLFALLALVLATSRRHWVVALLLVLLILSSLFGFNRFGGWDNWAVYFIGAYGLGAATWWLGRPGRIGRLWRVLWPLLVLATLLALALDFRSRIALALATSLLLALGTWGGWLQRWPRAGWVQQMGAQSYAVFLLNFPVILVFNALFTAFVPPNPWLQTLGMVLAWLACNLAGAVFHSTVERRLLAWVKGPKTPRRLPTLDSPSSAAV